MKNFWSLLLFVGLIGMFSCDPDTQPPVDTAGDLEVSIEAEFSGEPFLINKDYTFPDGRKVRFSKFDFYIAGIQASLQDADGSESLELAEVDFINLASSEMNPLGASEFTVNAINLPVGNYDNLSFTFGLSPELNLKTPNDSDLGSENPLKKASHYWTDWGSYIFMKIEGTADFNLDGQITGDETFIYHTGKTGYEQFVALNTDFTVDAERTTEKKIALEVVSLFFDGTEERFNMVENTSVHSDLEVMEKLMKGAAEGFAMKE